MRVNRWKQMGLAGLMAGAYLALADSARAQTSNAMLQASIAGTIGIEEVGQNSQPRLSQANFNSATFAQITGLPALSPDVVLVLNYQVTAAGTNLFLTVRDTANKTELARVTVAEDTVWFFDGTRFIFRLHAILPARFPDFAGGILEIAGGGKFVGHGAPSGITATVRGVLTEIAQTNIPGLLLKATLRTSTPVP